MSSALNSSLSSPLKILIVDDFEMVRTMLRNALKDLGYVNYSESENGKDAWQKLEGAHHSRQPFQMILCDWNMPEMSGLELLEKCRESEKYRNVPFIMVTAEAEQDYIVNAIRSGATDYIIKPFSPEMLEKKLNRALAKLQKPA